MTRPKYESYKIEHWVNKSQEVLVKRDNKGHFISWEIFNSYRMSYGITGKGDGSTSVPVHSTKQKPNYYGFTIFAYNTKPEHLNEIQDKLKSKLKKLIEDYINNLIKRRYNWSQLTEDWISDYIGYESPKNIKVDKNVLDTWEFIVENNGNEVYSDNGDLGEL